MQYFTTNLSFFCIVCVQRTFTNHYHDTTTSANHENQEKSRIYCEHESASETIVTLDTIIMNCYAFANAQEN